MINFLFLFRKLRVIPFFIVTGLIAFAGCIPLQVIDPTLAQQTTAQVPANPFGSPGKVAYSAPQFTFKPADKEMALRVHAVGQQLLTANPEIGMKPLCATIGEKRPELFHLTHPSSQLPSDALQKAATDGRVVYITEGLVERCKTDAQLAALLAHEFAEMVVEREVLANPAMRSPDERLPVEVMIGNGIGRSGGNEIHLAELARHEKKHRRPRNGPLPIPNPKKLAERYLQKTGYAPEELNAVAPLFEAAERTYSLEKQLKQSSGSSPNNNWRATK